MNLSHDLRIDLEYIREIRRRLHMCPEIGFELPETTAIVKAELDKMGIGYTEKYCKSSIVAFIGDLNAEKTIALRADMDALNITEENDVPYKSRNEGRMHACGHDAHTAVLLGVLKALKEYEKTNPLSCRVMAVFQPSEEGMATGARVMVENGIMDEIDFIIGGHVDPGVDTGSFLLSEGPAYAANNVFTIDIKGKSAHASQPYNGIDAGWMASDLYMRIREFMSSDAFTDDELRILNIGMGNYGTAVNIVPSDAKLTCTLRTYSGELVKRIMNGIGRLCDDVAGEYGGSVKINYIKELPPVINQGAVCEYMQGVIKDTFGEDKLAKLNPTMGSEDFAWYLTKKPGTYWSFGCRQPGSADSCKIHHNLFNIDENALMYEAALFGEAVVRYDKALKNGDILPA